MKIIEHGKVLMFQCKSCDCRWSEGYNDCERIGTYYWSKCPDCGYKNMGEIKIISEDELEEEE